MHPFSHETHYNSNHMFLLKIDPYKTTQDQYIKSTEKKLSVCVGTWSKKLRARFRRRSTHVLNLTHELSTAKERRLNQFGTAVLVRCGKSVWCGQSSTRGALSE